MYPILLLYLFIYVNNETKRKIKRFQRKFVLNQFFLIFAFRRVHISEKTLNFLDGEFEVEPAYGEKREESLRLAGLKTFFITKTNKPVS